MGRMATKKKYMAADDMKRKLIEITYRMIVEEGVENVSARKIAKEAECTAPLIYIHFDSLNYLIVLASIRFLEPYFEDIIQYSLIDENNPIECDRKAWHSFIRFAFRNPRVFENLFWGEGNAIYGDAILEYFTLYPQKEKNSDVAYHFIAISNSSLQERDLLWLIRGVKEGRIREEDAVYISKIVSPLVHSLLWDYIYDKEQEKNEKACIEECIALVDETFRRNIRDI